MAVVKAPALSIDASGNLGSICYSKWRGMNIARAAWSGVQTSTADQLNKRGKLTTVSQYWGTYLTQAQRDVWNDWAKGVTFKNRFGMPYNPTGYQLFMKWNLQRMMCAYSTPLDEPGTSYIPSFTDLTATWQATYNRWQIELNTLIAGDSFDGWSVYIAGPYDNQSRNPIEPEFNLDGHKKTTGVYNLYPLLPAKWYWVRTRFFSEHGQTGEFLFTQLYAG